MILTIKIIFACKQYVNLAATRHKRGEVGWGWGRVMERDGTETLTVAIHNMQALITGPEMRDEAVDSRFVSKVSISIGYYIANESSALLPTVKKESICR